jgi:hypothetical protein
MEMAVPGCTSARETGKGNRRKQGIRKTGDRQIIANIFLNGVEIVPSRSFKGMETLFPCPL